MGTFELFAEIERVTRAQRLTASDRALIEQPLDEDPDYKRAEAERFKNISNAELSGGGLPPSA